MVVTAVNMEWWKVTVAVRSLGANHDITGAEVCIRASSDPGE
jgi:hypothetical protein